MKKFKPYLYTSLLVLFIISIVFIFKGIYPFGSNSLIWGDMHDQITTFYYHLYDAVYNNGGLFVDYRVGGGVNFVGIIAYYISSPLSLLVLLVPRTNIYQVVSVIVALKILLCSLTCLYFIRYTFKKIPSMLQVMLAIIYAFSGYALFMYQITSWIDAMYIFPILMIGLKKLLDLEKPTLYIVCLTLSLIFSFYVSMMSILFIFFASLIYLKVYSDKDKSKKAITSLGLCTILSVLMSLFIVVPAYLEINESSRIGFKLATLINSRLGPITDKVSMLLFGGLLYVGIYYLLVNYKSNKKFLSFYLPTCFLVLVPYIVEPINKVWHLGSYASFPCRFGFITMFLLVLGCCYGLNTFNEYKRNEIENKKVYSMIMVTFFTLVVSILTIKYLDSFQIVIHRLSLSYNSKLIFILIIIFLLSIVSIYTVIRINRRLNKFTIIMISIISIVHIFSSCSMYLGMHKYNERLTNEYSVLLDISKDYEKNNNYRLKTLINPDNTVTNSGIVNKYSNMDYFTSLTNKNTLEAFKKLGYSSKWVITYSRGATVFMDSIMGNKYIVSDNNDDINYYELVKNYDNLSFYESDNKVSFGFLINKNDTIFDKKNSFEIANSLYKNILDTNDDLFKISSDFTLKNIEFDEKNNGFKKYYIENKDKKAYFVSNIHVDGSKYLYLELVNSLDNSDNKNVNEKLDLYVNGTLIQEDVFMEPYNGVVDLGIFEDCDVEIKIVLKDTALFKDIYIGEMDINKYLDFLDKYYLDYDLKFNKDNINIKVNSSEDKILFLPINYSKNYKAYNNGKSVEVLKLYDNFIGIKLNEGDNNITIKYVPRELIIFGVISLIGLISAIVILKTKLYNIIINNSLVNNISCFVYNSVYIAFILVFYILLFLLFLVSFIKYINI